MKASPDSVIISMYTALTCFHVNLKDDFLIDSLAWIVPILKNKVDETL